MPRVKQKSTHNRQRQRLIEACLSALHVYGPSRTTVEKVVAIAKMSPGIVRFYFTSKAAMLIASLQFLASEFEELVLAPVARLKADPVAALRLLVELYLDPDIASPRKVSVWYAFWGEASSRQEYYDICGQKDEGFAALVRELIERLILQSAQAHLDSDAIALGLIGVLEMLWQDFAFKDAAAIDRGAAQGRAMAYLRSVFPGQFTPSHAAPPALGHGALSTWTYENARLYAMEREYLFQNSWQFVAHRGQLAAAGDFLSNDLGFERTLIVRGADEQLRAFRNSCPEAPHALVAPGGGRQPMIRCAVHGLSFGLDGKASRGVMDLLPMDVRQLGELVLVRAMDRPPSISPFPDRWQELLMAPGARPSPARTEVAIAADWKILAEMFLTLSPAPLTHGWSARLYERLTGHGLDATQQFFLAPNHWLSIRPDGWAMLQILPTGPGRCALRQYHCTWLDTEARARAAQYLAARLFTLGALSGVAESTQRGMVDLGHQAAQVRSPAVSAFHRQLLSLLPVMAFDKPVNDF